MEQSRVFSSHNHSLVEEELNGWLKENPDIIITSKLVAMTQGRRLEIQLNKEFPVIVIAIVIFYTEKSK